MGQLSLVRADRLNTSMIWEGGVGDEQFKWLSTKLYIYLKFFIISLFKVKQYNFSKFWKSTCKVSYSSYNISQNAKWKNLSYGNLIKQTKLNVNLHILQIYLYTQANNQIVLILYVSNDNASNFIFPKTSNINVAITNPANYFLY